MSKQYRGRSLRTVTVVIAEEDTTGAEEVEELFKLRLKDEFNVLDVKQTDDQPIIEERCKHCGEAEVP